jgi:hypothetical protein
MSCVGAAASPRSYSVQAHKETCVCPHGEEVHARKWKFYAPTQDTALSTTHCDIEKERSHILGEGRALVALQGCCVFLYPKAIVREAYERKRALFM